MGVRITTDTLTPGMRKLARALDAGGRKDLLEAMALELKSATVEAFQSPADRPAPWPAKRDGSPSNLVDTTALRQSFQINATGREASVSTDLFLVAPAHQFGVEDRNLPARPFFPFIDGRITNAASDRIRAVAEDKLKRLLKP